MDKNAKRVIDPYSASQLRKMASQSQILQNDWISKDRKQWVKADCVREHGLSNGQIYKRQKSGKVVAKKFWIRHAAQVFGPYSGRELKKIIEKALIAPEDEISKDREHWKKASRVIIWNEIAPATYEELKVKY